MIKNLKYWILYGYFFVFSTIPCLALHSLSEQSVRPDAESNFKTTISAQLGFLTGKLGEYVYSRDLKISQLDWDIRSLYFIGATVNVQFLKMFFANIGYWSGLNREIGKVTDSDYSNGTLSDISRHSNTLQKLYFFDVNAGYTQRLTDQFSLTGLIGYNLINAKMAARNGYLEYPAGSAPQPFYGTGIANEQTNNIPYFGIGANLAFSHFFYTQIFGMYSPIVYCQGVDYHYRRQIDFFTNITAGQFYSLMGSFGWKITRNASLILSIQYTSLVTQRGESYYVDLTTGRQSAPSPGTGSASFNSTSFTLSIEHTLRWL